MWSIVGASCVLFVGVLAQSVDPPVVIIDQGTVVGSPATDGDYIEFHGIPYADSTSGRNRFKAPLAPPSFQDVFVANRRDIKCVRALGVGYEGTEDCLVANVYTPSLRRATSIPVMVWIKGKEFDEVYKPDLSFRSFMENDVVIVSLNYRESIFGYLCLGTETAPGNAGLKDIIAGLQWVQQNIARFGGDPHNITLFGHGSGAAAVDLVSLSPMSEGLIHKVIAQSGTALSPWAVTRDNIKYALDVAEALGHKITTIEDLSEVFTRTGVAALMAIINELDLTDNSLAFAPCLEKETLEGGTPFLIKSPFEIITAGEHASIPFMTGFVDKEGTIRAEEALEDDWLEKMNEEFSDFIQPDLSFENDEQKALIVGEIKNYYFGNKEINMTQINEYLSYHGDTMILVSAVREMRMRAASSTAPVYLYQFSYKGNLGEPFVGPLQVENVTHSEELAYLFRNFSNTDAAELDLVISDILIERWTSFAKTGNPESNTSPIEWRPFTANNSYYLRILDKDEVSQKEDATLELELENPHPETMTFWSQIYENHFLDAESRWNLTERNEEEEDNVEDGDGAENEGSGEDEGNEEDDGNGQGEEDNEDDEGDGEGEDGAGEGEDGDGEGEDGDGEGEDGDGEGEDGDGEDGDGEDGDGEDGDGEDDENGNGGGNSATTAVGFTFLIISFYAVLDKLHMSQLIS